MGPQKHIEPQLQMRRKNLAELPLFELPAEFSERSFQDADIQAWCEIISASFEDSWTAERFAAYMRGDPAFRPERIRFICDEKGVPCATASAYRRPEYGDTVGYVHMVGVLPQMAGKKLGYAASLAVLLQLERESCVSAVLKTDDFRLPAIKTYLRLGFEPMLVAENQNQRWRDVYAALSLGPPNL